MTKFWNEEKYSAEQIMEYLNICLRIMLYQIKK